jgi:rhodanese-related sulfurtransferase
MDASISAAELRKSLLSSAPPLIIDVRRNERFLEAADLIRGALRRDPASIADWSKTLPRADSVVVYCVHGHEVSQNAAKALGAKYLEGGIEHWREEGGELARKPANAPTRWVTRERPKIDRIACPWLVRRFIDPGAEFFYMPVSKVHSAAVEKTAIPYDVADVEFTHVGERCSFDAFLDKFHLQDPALQALATIVRGADTGRLELAPQAAGLLAISQGLSRVYQNDLEMLEHGMVMYDALYAWCRQAP